MKLPITRPRRAAWALCLCAGTASGQPCPGDTPALRGLPKAIEAWEARSASRLGTPLRQSLSADVCEAAADLVQRRLATPSAVDAALARTMASYLDLQFQTAQPPRTVASLLRAEFNVGGGFAKPQMRRLVRVDFRYVKSPEYIAVEGHEYPKPSALVLPASDKAVTFKGLKRGMANPLCEQSLPLVAGQAVEFVCR